MSTIQSTTLTIDDQLSINKSTTNRFKEVREKIDKGLPLDESDRETVITAGRLYTDSMPSKSQYVKEFAIGSLIGAGIGMLCFGVPI